MLLAFVVGRGVYSEFLQPVSRRDIVLLCFCFFFLIDICASMKTEEGSICDSLEEGELPASDIDAGSDDAVTLEVCLSRGAVTLECCLHW